MTRLANFYKKHKNIIVAVILFCLVICVFFTAYKVRLVAATQKIYYDVVNYGVINETQPFENSDTVDVNAVFNEDFGAIALMVNVNNAQSGSLNVQVYDEQQQLVASGTKQLSEIATRDFTSINLDSRLQAGIEYEIVITAYDMGEGEYITFLTDDSGNSITLAGQYDVIGNSFTNYFLMFTIISAIVAAAAYLMYKCEKMKLHTFAMCAVLLLGVLYNIVLPPYSAPDEAMHINQAFNESTIMLNAPGEDEINHWVNFKRASDNNEIVQDAVVSPLTYREITEEFFTLTNEDAHSSVEYDEEQVSGYRLPYFISGLFISIARLLHFGFVPTLYFARLANLIFYAVVVYFTVKISPIAKSMFAVISLIPISLHVANSFSRDGFIISMALLLVAMALRIAKDENMSIKFCLIFSILFMLFLPSKATYIPLLLILFIMPFRKFSKAKKYILAVFLPCASVVFYITQNIVLFNELFSSVLGNITLSVTHAVAQISASVSTNVDYVAMDTVTYDLLYILTNIQAVIILVVRTFFENTQYYIYTMFGGSLGYFDIDISWIFVIGFIALLLLAVNNNAADDMILTAKQKAILFASSLVGCALVVLGCITWTPVYYTTIYGLQGRYFTPVLAGIAILAKFKFISITKDISKHIIFAAVLLNIGVLLNAMYIISTR